MEHFKEIFAVVGAGIGVLTGLLTLYIKFNEARKIRTPAVTETPPQTPQLPPPPPVEHDWIPLTPVSDTPEVRRAKAIPVVPVAYPQSRGPRPSSRSKRVGPSQELIASIKTPALMMIVVGILSVLSNLTFAGYGFVDQFVTPLSDRSPQETMPQKFHDEQFQNWADPPMSKQDNIIAIGFFLGMAIGSACAVLAGFGMNQLSGYNMSILGSVAIMVSTFGCCFIGVPIGIWCLIVLLDGKVHEAFQS
jgi:hypothetical protein